MSPRLLVTGRYGQIATALAERAALEGSFVVVSLGRPQFDLADPSTVGAAIEMASPDIIVSAAAYTAVDQAETEEDLATRMNGLSAEEIAKAADRLGVPIIHISTDYVFDGLKSTPYVEDDIVAPIGAYGRSKLAGEIAVRAATAQHVILRTAWVYSPFGKNFLKTMLRLAETRESLSVVDDQTGNPTSAIDIADGILTVASNLLSDHSLALRGTFHMSGNGAASWADFAEEIFSCARLQNGPFATVNKIATSEYPTPARRPANSRLNCSRLRELHGINLPHWQSSTAQVVERLLAEVRA